MRTKQLKVNDLSMTKIDRPDSTGAERGSQGGGAGDSAVMSIAAVERDTGLSKDTLRVWERRYGFPLPARDASGERAYSSQDVDKLRAIRRLLDAGHRPGKIIRLPLAELRELAREAADAAASPAAPAATAADLALYLELIRSHRTEELRMALSQVALRQGLEHFVVDVCAPLNRLVGDAWARGELEVFEEHLYTESLQVVLRHAIGNISSPGSLPRVLLTTFPAEPHGLGLLMAEAMLALEGCRCTSLGTRTPVWDIVLAARAHEVDIVALSFSASLNPKQVVDGLAELRAKLDESTEIWAGGQCPVLRRRPPAGVRVLPGLAAIRDAIADWRSRARPN